MCLRPADGGGGGVQIGDIRGFVGICILALTQQFPWMFEEPDEYLNYQLGNTSLCWHNGRLLALMEGGMPFQAHVGEDGGLASVGPYDFDGRMVAATSGHPKICPLTGEMHSFFYRCVPPHLVWLVCWSWICKQPGCIICTASDV